MRLFDVFLDEFCTVLLIDGPFHAFPGLVSSSRYLVEIFVQGQIMADRILRKRQPQPTRNAPVNEESYLPSRMRMSEVGKPILDPLINSCER